MSLWVWVPPLWYSSRVTSPQSRTSLSLKVFVGKKGLGEEFRYSPTRVTR